MTPEALLRKCISSAYGNRDAAEEEERDLVERGQRWELLVERENRTRMLLEPDVLAKVTRYESNLERSFFRTLHELQRLQASRSGAVVPPPVAIIMDVDLSTKPESMVEPGVVEDPKSKIVKLPNEPNQLAGKKGDTIED